MNTKDVQSITGKGRTAAQKIVAAIKSRFSKTRAEQITVEEFCTHTGLKVDLVLAQLS